MNMLIQELHNHKETYITVKVSRRTQKVEIHLVNEGSSFAIFSMEIGHKFTCIGCNDFQVLFRWKEPHKPEFAQVVARINSLMIYTDLIEHKIVGDTKVLLLRSLVFISELKVGDDITTGQYMSFRSFSNLKFRPLLKNSFPSIHIELRYTSSEKIASVSAGNTRFVLMFKKASNIHF